MGIGSITIARRSLLLWCVLLVASTLEVVASITLVTRKQRIRATTTAEATTGGASRDFFFAAKEKGAGGGAPPNGTDGSPPGQKGKVTEGPEAEVWDEESLTKCCAYEHRDGKRLRGPNVMRPRDTLADAQDACDAVERCRGVVALGNGSGVPVAYRNKFALKSNEEVVDGEVGTALYLKGACEEKRVCQRGNATAGAPLQNASNVSSDNATLNASCVTRLDSRVAPGWWAEMAPAGTPCIFGADPRDEGRHCVHVDDNFGSYGWCYTRKDRSAWGSCSEVCPLIGHFRVLGSKLDDLTEMVDDLISKKEEEKAEEAEAANMTGEAAGGAAPTVEAVADGRGVAAPAAPSAPRPLQADGHGHGQDADGHTDAGQVFMQQSADAAQRVEGAAPGKKTRKRPNLMMSQQGEGARRDHTGDGGGRQHARRSRRRHGQHHHDGPEQHTQHEKQRRPRHHRRAV